MKTEEFAENFYLEKKDILKSIFDDNESIVSQKIKELNLNKKQEEKLKGVFSDLLTDAFYSILLGFDGSTSIGDSNQEVFKIYDEQENLISDCGELEAEAYNYFHNYEYEFQNSDADFIASLDFLSIEENEVPVKNIKLKFNDFEFFAKQEFIDREIVFYGEQVVSLIKTELFEKEKLTNEMKFEIFNESKLIGKGIILRVMK